MLEVEKYFTDLVKSDDRFSGYDVDLGTTLLAKAINYKINEASAEMRFAIQELYYPQTEEVLLAKMLYEVGKIRFKRPLIARGEITSQDSFTLARDTEFTSGNNLFYLLDTTAVNAGEPKIAYFVLQQRFKEIITLENGRIYAYHTTSYGYKDIHNITVRKGNTLLRYSQNFIDGRGDYSFEIDPLSANVKIVFLLGNARGQNLQLADNLELTTFITDDTKDAPSGLTPIDSTNLVVDNITIHQNHTPAMSIKEMQNEVKYGRKGNGDLILNEDYSSHLHKEVGGFKILKVWQEREENKESFSDISNINKVFYSYLTVDNIINDIAINARVQSAISRAITGKEAVFREAIVVPLQVHITIVTDEAYSHNIESYIKSILLGYYDDLLTPINKAMIYKKVFEELRERIMFFDLEVSMQDKGIYKNRNIFELSEDTITVNISQNTY